MGNGIFECVQDLVGDESLCYLRLNAPALYEKLFRKVGETDWRI